MSEHIDQLRRLRVLQALGRITPIPMGEIAILNAVRVDPELSPTIERVRKSLRYLGGIGFVELITVPDTDWLAARTTSTGNDWLAAPEAYGDYEIYHPSSMLDSSADGSGQGRTSTIHTLPMEAKAWLDQELVRRSFTGYIELAELLAQQGYEISKSALGRYGKKFKEEQKQLKQSIEMAKAFAEVVGDDGAAMNQTLTALAQQELMSVIREGRYDDSIKLPALIRSIASLNRSDINTRNYQIEQAARSQALDDAATAAESTLIRQGASKETIRSIKDELLGLK